MHLDLRAALICAALCTALWSHPATAQKAAARSPAPLPALRTSPRLGSAITLGVGVARREPYCGTCADNLGFAGLVNLSRFVNHVMALGMESTVWLNRAGSVSAALGSAMGTATIWAAEAIPLSISGGLGFVVYHQGDAAYQSNTTSVGFGWSGRVGYDASVSSTLALVPYIGFVNSLERLRVGRSEQLVSSLQVGMALRFR